MTEQQFMDFRSKYLDIYDTFAGGSKLQKKIKRLTKIQSPRKPQQSQVLMTLISV